ncbi:hypothetical protein ACKUSY_09400 [Myroides odoratus]
MPLYKVKYYSFGVIQQETIKLPSGHEKVAKEHLLEKGIKDVLILNVEQVMDMKVFNQLSDEIKEEYSMEDLPDYYRQHMADQFVKDNRPAFLDYIGVDIYKIGAYCIIGIIILLVLFFIS